ncbi:glutamate--cysteine ligase [Leifsonia aquatica]|uniref:Putative glutamate--cysteine ligase 2 n=2 Tax=Leifsonia aquatica TaxID=144185 RepID=U2TC41_LEIAQ|nr:glutamate--cysteine ligase [Leifsonia aquatica]ERK72272.1 carboxylate-amine ligase, YbdK family [Leifsonia aquatica ATCC 14665]MBB2966131.1 carboxylate-amine ligase [Leifsonia aquatica]
MQIEFSESERSTVGIEWEIALVDGATGDLVQIADEVLRELGTPDGREHPQITHELLLNTVELVSRVHRTVPAAVADLQELIGLVREVTDPLGVELLCAGTHPFAQWYDQKVTPNERYDRLLDRTQWWGRQMMIWGVHVHVGVDERDKALPIVNGLLSYYPHLQALSASSPYWAGAATGYASNRALMFQQLPTAGLPWQFGSWANYEEYVQDLVTTGVVTDHSEVRWDIRPSPKWGTVEMRACDGLSTTDEVGAVAALIHCLTDRMSGDLDEGVEPVTLQPWFVRENKWRAARYGLDAEIIVAPDGSERLVSESLRELVDELQPTAERLGCEEELRGVLRILDGGASYQRQLAVAAANGGSLQAVVSSLTHELRSGLTR